MVATNLFTQYGIFVGNNVQVTKAKPGEPRSESSIVADPQNPSRLLGASKHFTDPVNYQFSLGAVFSDDFGTTWKDRAAFPLRPEHDIYTDPSTAFDTKGHCWVMGDPGFDQAKHPNLVSQLKCQTESISTTQMRAFTSSNDGATWSAGIDVCPWRCTGDDKGWIVCDNSTARVHVVGKKTKPKSPFHGRLYAIWGALTPFRFAYSDDGTTWTGVNGSAPGSDVCDGCYGPDISIGSNGWLHVFWHNPGDSSIQYVRSKDGGNSFQGSSTAANGQPVPWNPVTGITDLSSASLLNNPPITQNTGWPVFEGSTFRAITIVSAACFGDTGLVVVWADARSGHSRTYYRVSNDNGDTWEGDPSGTPLLPMLSGNSHQFHPQVSATGSGVVGCAMYSYSKNSRNGHPGVEVLMACSFDQAVNFDFAVVTDQPWDPSLHAPIADGVGTATFIGDYFGLDASATDFHLLWTDTRTGTQDLFYCGVATQRINRPNYGEIYGTVTAGVMVDGGGYMIINGHIIRIPPWDPMLQIMTALGAIQDVSRMTMGNSVAARQALYDVVIDVARQAKATLEEGE